MNKWDFIDWEKTQQKLGYTSQKLRAADHVLVQCHQCKELIEVRYDSVRGRGGKSYQPTCRSCNSKKQWENQEHKQSISIKISLSMRKVWDNKEYARSQREKHKISGKRKWQDNEYRDKIKSGVKKAHANNPKYTKIAAAALKTEKAIIAQKKALQEKRKCKDYRNKLSKASKNNWNNPIYRERMLSILTSEEFIQKQIKTHSTPEYLEKMAQLLALRPRVSSIQLQLYKYLDDLNIGFREEGPETIIGYYVFDCLIPKQGEMCKNLLIECQGDYWHSLPKAIRNDKSKFTYIDRYFPEHEVMYVWEHEFSAKDRVLDRLKLKLGVDVETVDFDFKDIELKELSNKDTKEFLDAYHYIGKGRGGRCFGAFLDDKLIGCVVFSSPLRQNTAGQFNLADGDVRELSRFCIHPSYHKKNFASWLISKTIGHIKGLIIAYADTTVGHTGAIYRASNFTLHHEVAPDYWYVDKGGFVMHKKTLYGRARKMCMKESDFAKEYGYGRKWGGRKLCYIYAR